MTLELAETPLFVFAKMGTRFLLLAYSKKYAYQAYLPVMKQLFMLQSFSALLDESASFSGTIVPIQVDIRKEASVQNVRIPQSYTKLIFSQMARAVDSELQKSNRRLFAVVNNAGVITNGPIEMQTMQEVEFQFDVRSALQWIPSDNI